MVTRRLLPLALTAILVLCAIVAAQDKVLYEKKSPYNTIFVTEDDRGMRTLQFERYGARQSVMKVGDPDHLELPYARFMLVGLALHEKPQRVLILGLGGGTIPTFLHRHYPRMPIAAVDIDPEVVNVAKKFFAFREDERMRAHVDDGRRFIEACKKPYDVIFLDAFGTENVPYDLATREFLQAVRRAVSPKGIVLGNIWGRGSNPLYDSMVRTYQSVFEQLYVLEVEGRGNRILIALPHKRPIERDDLVQRARKLAKARQFGFDLADCAAAGFHGLEEPNTRGSVLLDKNKAKKAG